jgi:sulfatase modifying factor 1
MGLRQRWVLAVLGFVGVLAGACSSFSTQPTATAVDSGTPDVGPGPSDASNDVDTVPVVDPCSGFDAGPKMALVSVSGLSFCVDTVEVSFDQYRAYRLAPDSGRGGPPPLDAGGLSDPCRTFETDSTETRGAYPALVGYCAARAYCAWAGKRLCSAVYKPTGDLDALGEWYLACSPGGTDYPWGDGVSDAGGRCPGAEGIDAARPVGSSPECRAPEAGVYDMIGNAAEWVGPSGDVDDRDGGTQSFAAAVRGRARDGGAESCRFAGNRVGQRIGGPADNFGIRCCADVPK